MSHTPPSPAAEPLPFGPYRLLRELGRGGMGTVWLAEVSPAPPAPVASGATDDESREMPEHVEAEIPPGTRVAIKTFHPHLVSAGDFARRFRREARSGAAIRHANVVRTLDAGTAPLEGRATSYLAMEYVEGQTLRDLMREMGRLPEELARTIARQVAAGLAAIHEAGITHRDLKPENVILTKDHHVKLMDLGVAKVREESIRLSLTGQFLGSVHYASPEQFRAPETVDARTDLYALGVLLHEMLAGENPFFHDDLRVVLRKTLGEMPRRLSQTVSDVSPVLDQLARSLVEKSPGDRVQTASGVLDVLERGEESAWWRDRGRGLWAESAGRVVRRLPVSRDTPLTGRDEALAALRAEMDLAAAGERRVVWLEGEAGIGKTRLLDEFAAALAEGGSPVRFLYGSSPAPGTGRPFHAFSEALIQGVAPEEPRAALARLLPPGSPVDEFAALVTGSPGADVPVERARSLFAAAFRGLAVDRPLLLVVDDLQLAAEQSATLLAYLAHDDRATPMLLVAAFRPPDESHPLHGVVHGGRETNVRHLALPRLGPKDVAQMLRNLLRSERLVQELGFRLLEKTEGNPLFLLEVVRSLQGENVLRRREDGAWTMGGTRIEIHVPDSVRDLVATQLARLDDADREILDVASVMGNDFDPEVVAEVLGQPKIALLRRLSSLERRQRLIRAVGRRCRFDHQQLRETLYEGVMEGLREEYHAQIGACLARRRAASKTPLDGPAHLELLHHFVLGARPAEAAEHVLPGLRHAAQAYRTEQGAALGRRFLDVSGEAASAETAAEVRLLVAGFLEHEGERGEARAILDRARADAQAAADRPLLLRILERSLLLSFSVGAFDQAARTCREAFRLASRLEDHDAALAALVSLAAAQRCLGLYDAAAVALRRCQTFLLPEGSVLRRTIVLTSLAAVEHQRGRARTAQRLHREAATLAQRFGAGPSAPALTPRRGHTEELPSQFRGLSRALGRSTESRVDGERAILMASQLPRRVREGAALVAEAGLATQLGLHDEARASLSAALTAAREGADIRFEASVLHALGENAVEGRDPEVARKWFEESLELRRRIGQRPGVCETLLALGQLAALGGHVDAARGHLDEATELAAALDMPAIAALARAAAALFHAREGRAERARAELAEAQQALSHPGPFSIASRVEGLWFASLAARALGDEAAAQQHLAGAWDALQEVASRMTPDERRSFLLETSPHREIVAAVGAAV